MTNWTTIALMAAALLLAVPGQPRAQTTDGETPAVESVCPCGDPADIVPFLDWRVRDVQCTAPPTSGPHIFSLRVLNFSVPVLQASPDSCLWAGDRPAVQIFDLTVSQADACGRLLISYAQALKDAGTPVPDDSGCNLQ